MKSVNDEKTYFEEYGETLLKRMGISKTEFAEKMGVKKQNVNVLFATKNIILLKKAAQVLGVPVETLIADAEQPQEVSINGYVEVNGEVFKIRDKEELLKAVSAVEAYQNKIEN